MQGVVRLSVGRLVVLSVFAVPAVVTAQEQTEDIAAKQLSTITVNASADASKDGLLPEYAGGQVASGGRVGILGSLSNMDSPFSVNSYTSRYIEELQATTVADVVRHDPSVRTARGFGNFQESFFIRGFLTASDDIAYNGLFGLLPRQSTAAELAERIEVLHGAGGFLYGAAPSGGGIGGTINVLPKRASDDPLTQVGVGYATGAQRYIKADISRRFADNAAGVRVNAVRRTGGTAVDGEHASLDLYTVGMDWRGERFRLSADVGYQEHKLREIRPNVTLHAGLTALPDMPSNKRNFAQPWTYSNEKTVFGTVRGEYDLNDAITLWAAYGMKHGKEENQLAGLTVTNAVTGDGTMSRFDNSRRDDVKTGELGVRASFETGPVLHELVAAASVYDHKEKNAWAMGSALNSNLYNPVDHALPPIAFTGGDLGSPGLVGRTKLTSYTIGDLMYMWDDRLELMLGLRHQVMESRSYAYGTADLERKDKQRHTSPAVGLVFKLTDEWALYGNYTESLAQGAIAPNTYDNQPVVNAGQRLSAFVAKQKEVGVKYDNGSIGGGLTFFTTTKPRSLVNSDMYFEESGKDRHNGVELSFYGQLSDSLRLLGGVTMLDAKQKQTGDASSDGKRVIGVPRWQGNIGLTWDVPRVEGFSLDTQLLATGARYANASNSINVPGWMRWDVGASYTRKVSGVPVTVRASVENVANKSYWSSVGGYPNNGYLVLSQPRTFMLSVSAEF
ncbi:TonB-dependent receptor [Paenalcaligenes sp. Me131]|uniref:TonB-dependent receptor n=1 Tax=Paenalcaligenes sp. Me131 TaxID=3392636 RepID=UPI003D2B2BBB